MQSEQYINQLKTTLQKQQSAFNQQTYPDYKERLNSLKKLKALLLNNQQEFIEAMNQDFGQRCADDSRIGDILTTIQGINYAIKRLRAWMKPQSRHVSILFQPASAKVLYQPLGVVGIMVPWNYPLFLSLGPLTTALAAGNRAMVKMSEFTPNTNRLLAKLVEENYPDDEVVICEGDAKVSAAFSELPFDHIFFTGSTRVGQLVMQAAAKNLTPVTLELGGKSPAIISPEMNLNTAVSRFILGKTLNAGQTCVAPDYIFCKEEKIDELVNLLKERYQSLYPKMEGNPDCTSIVNDAQFQRINGLIEDARSKGATIMPLLDEANNPDNRLMPLTLILNTTPDMQVMQEEIFGPVLPIMGYKNTQDAIDYIQDNPRPLALYVFSFDKAFQRKVLTQTHSGGVCVNDATFHVAVDDLPFGGVGASGIGNYHGVEGFKTFSHAKGILSRGRISFASLLFPPFGNAIHKLVYKLFIR